jgi:serine/threonine-protein kinase
MGSWVVPGYTEVRELGRGTTGRVMLAWHDPTGTPVAIRYLSDELHDDEDFLRTFHVEAHRLTEIDSPHLARCYEYVETGDGAAMVMEFVDGAPLAAILARGGPVGPEAALAVLKGSLLGLAAAHDRGVLHRHHRPSNILIDTEGRSKLTELALAPRTSTSRSPYLAPERAEGGPATIRSDLYAAAAVFHECLVDSPGGVPAPLLQLAAAGVADDPAKRPADATAFLIEVEATAIAWYGADWDERGRDELASWVAWLLPAAESEEPAATGGEGRPYKRWQRPILIGVALMIIIAAAVASWVTH